MVESYGAPERRMLDDNEKAQTIACRHGIMTRACVEGLTLRLPDSPEEAEAKQIAKACKRPKATARTAGRARL
jgi:hypothetical protein